jgi:dTDP-4-dehydrorhamnose 3,5-epimerase
MTSPKQSCISVKSASKQCKIEQAPMMIVQKTELDGVLIIDPDVFDDERGFFFETYQRQRYADAGIGADFVQDNLSFSKKETLRGLHYQHPNDQAKLVQAIQGEVFDVSVDIRRESPTFGRWMGQYLSDEFTADRRRLPANIFWSRTRTEKIRCLNKR